MGWRDEEEASPAAAGVAETDFVEILSMVMDLKKANLVGFEYKKEDFEDLGYGQFETIQRRLAWPLRKDDTHKSRNGPNFFAGRRRWCSGQSVFFLPAVGGA